MSECSSEIEEAAFLEDNIATIAFHLGQIGARLSVSHWKKSQSGLIVEPGEVLMEVSRRLTRDVAQPSSGTALAYRLEHPKYGIELSIDPPDGDWAARGWTVTPLYAGVAQAAPEPVAWRRVFQDGKIFDITTLKVRADEWAEYGSIVQPLYASPPAPLPAGETSLQKMQISPAHAGWMPIETAPKDGSWIVAICNDHTQVYHVYWQADQEAWYGHRGAYGDGLFAPNGGWMPAPPPRSLTEMMTNALSSTNPGGAANG